MPKVGLCGGLFLQVSSAYGVYSGVAIWMIVAAHFSGALAWGYGARILPPSRTNATGWFMGATALVIPGLGWLASLFLLGLLNLRPPSAGGKSLLVWRERKMRAPGLVSRRIGIGASIAEILRQPNSAHRRSAILAAKELDVKAAIPLLRKGLQDSDEQVRIYAQNILSGLLEKFESRIKELERKSREQPTDSATAVSLAEQYFELVYLDVAGDEETSEHLLKKSVEMLERAAVNAPKNSHIAFLQLRYALRQRNVEAARTALKKLETLKADEQMVLPWRMELDYQVRDWVSLKRHLAYFINRGYPNPRIENLARFWGADNPV
ncbi:MAG: hypothetical protein SynsKO_39520 [Synoicihabitans sp.]